MAEELEDLWLLFAVCSQCVDGPPVPMMFTDQDKNKILWSTEVETPCP